MSLNILNIIVTNSVILFYKLSYLKHTLWFRGWTCYEKRIVANFTLYFILKYWFDTSVTVIKRNRVCILNDEIANIFLGPP